MSQPEPTTVQCEECNSSPIQLQPILDWSTAYCPFCGADLKGVIDPLVAKAREKKP